MHDLIKKAGGFKSFFESIRRDGMSPETEVTRLMREISQPFGDIGFRVTKLSEGFARLTFPLSEAIKRSGGMVNGGIAMYALDTTLGIAVMTLNSRIDQMTLERFKSKN